MYIKKENFDYNETSLTKAAELKSYIRNNIPLTDFMDFNIDRLSDYSIKVSVPIESNGNHYGTAFGGSIATLGILSGWALLQSKMNNDNVKGTLVIKQSTTKYIAPGRTDFEAECSDLSEDKWEDFKNRLAGAGKAYITLHSELKSGGILIAKQESVYVGLAKLE